MRIATWNVNSLSVRLSQVIDWMHAESIDVAALQETKVPDERFPVEELAAAGIHAVFDGQKTYNGVAILTRGDAITLENVIRGIPGYPDAQKRFIAASLRLASGAPLTLACAYFPNGQDPASEKYLYKLEWIEALALWVREVRATGTPLLLGGDFNIAPADTDVWDPKLFEGGVPVTAPERDAWRRLLAAGLTDTWELELHAPETFSWWDYRQNGFELNHGLRIDHWLASPDLTGAISGVRIDTAPRALEKPSDHAPVVLEVDY